MKKIKILLIGMLTFAFFNTFIIAFANNNPVETNLIEEAQISPKGLEYHCYWLTGGWGGPTARDCMGCLERPMKEPQVQGTCKTGIQE